MKGRGGTGSRPGWHDGLSGEGLGMLIGIVKMIGSLWHLAL